MTAVAFLLIFAALMLLGGWAMDMCENAVFGSDPRDAHHDRVLRLFEDPEAIANRIHAQMVADGLIRDTSARERTTDAEHGEVLASIPKPDFNNAGLGRQEN